ncbi:hypothetical protein PUNSTDRAFT_33210, partial [Punctularia strigosozonata HHB-11173 SS5]
KKANQWRRWQTETIPDLIGPYETYIWATSHMTDDPPCLLECSCNELGRKLKVLAVFCQRLESIELSICSCRSAARQLLARGLFPCAPQSPSLAFDLNMLELVAMLFLNTAPNVTAWAATLETFLGVRKYHLRTKDSLRRRFGNALSWFIYLRDCVKEKTFTAIEDARKAIVSQAELRHLDEGLRKNGKLRGESWRPRAPAKPDGRQRSPSTSFSSYLRSRCLLCFGPNPQASFDDMPDVIVCLDACFTQKRCATTGRDPSRRHPASVFLPEAEVLAMEKESPRKRKGHAAPHASIYEDEDQEDRCDGPLKVPNSVLDGCEASFKAADESREKASTRFFDDTALMALMCRHDRVLWLANMTSAGERQHYAIALLDRFFRHIPASTTVGVLYDIGCQLQRSCYKWDLLPAYRDRITFGISVFHAYGHQWPCQVVYHPRKCRGFGLSDGESCERFWSAIDHLVPGLRVSGFFQRLYVIDSQVHHLDACQRCALGDWLAKKDYARCMRMIAAERGLADCNIPMETLRAEWEAQQVAQTKPIAKLSKDAGTKTIDSILLLEDQLRIFEKTITELERKVMAGQGDANSIPYRDELYEDRNRATRRKRNLEKALDLRTRRKLETLRGSKYLTHRMNALALKTRIRDRLRQRKFEFTQVERSFRSHSSTADKKLVSHTELAVHRREPGIQALARKYNGLCSDMAKFIQKRQAPARAIAPAPIVLESLWRLDVDDDIWQDTGLVDDDEEDGMPPRWLADEKVRAGIRHMLEADRCREEARRISKERTTMQLWLQEEWSAVNYALSRSVEDRGLEYQLSIYRDELLTLAVTWRRDVATIPPTGNVGESWGPTEDEMSNAI